MPPPPELADDLLGEAFLRLPPDDPACLLRASLVCKRWRRILADPAFRRRHRKLYPAPSVVGFVQVVRNQVPYCSRFVSENPASGRPAGRDLPGWLALDCRHGRALFVTPATVQDTEEDEEDFVVWDPLTDERHILPPPSPPPNFRKLYFNAAVLCAAASGSCDHVGCHGGPFRVAFVFTSWDDITRAGIVTSASLYSSETGVWSRLTSVQHPVVAMGHCPRACSLVDDTLYFRVREKYVFEYQVGAQRLSVIEQSERLPFFYYMASVDGKLGFFNVEEAPSLSLCLWSQETTPNGFARWARGRVIKLEALLPSDALLPPPPNHPIGIKHPCIIGFAEGTDVILLAIPTQGSNRDVYMVQLNSGRAKKIFESLPTVYAYKSFTFPYTSFSIPVIDSASTGEGPEKGVSSV